MSRLTPKLDTACDSGDQSFDSSTGLMDVRFKSKAIGRGDLSLLFKSDNMNYSMQKSANVSVWTQKSLILLWTIGRCCQSHNTVE